MKYLKITFALFLLIFPALIFPSTDMAFEVKQFNSGYSKLKILILCQSEDKLLMNVGKLISENLDFTDQFDVDVKKTPQSLSSMCGDGIKKLFSQGFSIVAFVNGKTKRKKSEIKILVKDTNSDSVLFEKSFDINEKNFLHNTHSASNEIIKTLTGEDGICLSTLAYCKALSSKHKVLCMSDYLCHKENVIIWNLFIYDNVYIPSYFIDN